MDRRKFIRNAASFVTLPVLLNGQAIQVFASGGIFSPEETNGKKLVLIQLDGGNDGLNMLVPLDMYANLAKARPEVILPEKKIIMLNDKQGIHPAMTGVKSLFDEGKFMFVQNVGYPQPNLSHFRSKEIILSASDSQTVIPSGWFGRYLEYLHPQYPHNYPSAAHPHPLAITIGNSSSPTCQGEMNGLGVVLQKLSTSYESSSGEQSYPETPYGFELEFVAQVMKKTEKYLEVVSQAAGLSESLSALWPESNSLADQLKIVARLIAGGLNTPVYIVNLGGFDTHANQVVAGETETGKHASLMKQVSDAVFAFQDELKIQKREDEVIGLVYSEFGRRITSNKSNGTDHGAAFPMMLFGKLINPVVYGKNPVIPANVEPKANLTMETDFRTIYASILKSWFGLDKSEITQILKDEFNTIPILKSTVDSDFDLFTTKTKITGIYPNPVNESAILDWISSGGRTKITLVDTSGRIVKVFLNEKVPNGIQKTTLSRNGIPSGQYFIQLQNGSGRESKPVTFL